jgi:replicative DNA helicase
MPPVPIVTSFKPRDGEDLPTLRTPPHNFEAEMMVLGAVLANNKAYDRVSEFLLADHFADDRHGKIYSAIGKLIERGSLANPVTLKNFFEQAGPEGAATLAELGGTPYLAKLAGSVVTVVNAVDYARTVHDLFLRRQLIDIGEEVANGAYAFDLETTAEKQIEVAEQKLFTLASTGNSERALDSFSSALRKAIDLADAAHKRQSHVTGVTTGLIDLDRKLGGLHRSDLVILAARPGMGKSSLATKIAFSAAKARHTWTLSNPHPGPDAVADGAVVAFFSLEMSSEQLAGRMLSEQTEIPSDKIRRGEVRSEDFVRFAQVTKELASLPLYLDDTPALSISQLRTRARRLQRTHGLGLLIVDYLQLMSAPAGVRPENRVQEISMITRGLKAIAKELNVPVLALSQLSRQVENRDDKRPQLSDLRESGTIEQDADVVMFIYRAAYYKREPQREDGEAQEAFAKRHEEWQAEINLIYNEADVLIEKQRHGPTGKVTLFFDGAFTKFDNLARSDQHDGGH